MSNSNGATEQVPPGSWDNLSSITRNQALLGAVVTWRLNGMQVTLEDMRAALVQYALDAYMPSQPSPRLALRRAIEAMVRQNRLERNTQAQLSAKGIPALSAALVGADGSMPNRELIRPIKEPGDWHVYALVAEHTDIQQLSLTHATKIRFRVHKQTGSLFVTTTSAGNIDATTEAQALTPQVTAFYNFFRANLTGRDISALLKRIVGDLGSILLRPEGGAYFVPHAHLPILESTEQLVDRLARIHGGEAFFLVMGVPDQEAQKKRIARAAHLALQDRIETLGAELDKLATVEDEKALARHIGQYTVVRAEIEAYVSLLGSRQDDLVARLQTLAGRAARALVGDVSS